MQEWLNTHTSWSRKRRSVIGIRRLVVDNCNETYVKFLDVELAGQLNVCQDNSVCHNMDDTQRNKLVNCIHTPTKTVQKIRENQVEETVMRQDDVIGENRTREEGLLPPVVHLGLDLSLSNTLVEYLMNLTNTQDYFCATCNLLYNMNNTFQLSCTHRICVACSVCHERCPECNAEICIADEKKGYHKTVAIDHGRKTVDYNWRIHANAHGRPAEQRRNGSGASKCVINGRADVHQDGPVFRSSTGKCVWCVHGWSVRGAVYQFMLQGARLHGI